MFHTVKDVLPLEGYKLLIHFHSGHSRIYSMAPLIEKQPPFRLLAQVTGLFQQVKPDPGGYGVSWNDEIDLSCDELWYNGAIYPSMNNLPEEKKYENQGRQD